MESPELESSVVLAMARSLEEEGGRFLSGRLHGSRGKIMC
jgi:hypothetical protein